MSDKSMMTIEVLDRAPELYETTWDGVTKQRSRQWALLQIDGLPTAFAVTSEPGKEYPPGRYTLAPESFGVTNGRLTLSRTVLKPVAVPAGQGKPVTPPPPAEIKRAG